MAILKIRQQDGTWAIVNDPNAIKHIEQVLTEDQKTQARANIEAAKQASTHVQNWYDASHQALQQCLSDLAGTPEEMATCYDVMVAANTVASNAYTIADDVTALILSSNFSQDPNQIYGTDDSGNRTSYPISNSYQDSGVVLRESDGKIAIPDLSLSSYSYGSKGLVPALSSMLNDNLGYYPVTVTDLEYIFSCCTTINLTNLENVFQNSTPTVSVDDGGLGFAILAQSSNLNGEFKAYSVAPEVLSTAGEYVIVSRTSSGQLKVLETPEANDDATSKKYVDNTVDTKVSKKTVTSGTFAYSYNNTGDTSTRIDDGSLAGGALAKYFLKTGTASDTPSTIGGVLVSAEPTKARHVATKNYVDTSFVNKSGDTITGDLTITGNLQVKGISETVDAVTYKVENNLIEFNPDKTYNNTWLTGIAVNKGIKNEIDLGTYGIMYDPNADSVKLGFGTISENHTFTFNENESAPIATRDEFDESWEDDAIFVFDKTTKKFKYSGKTLSGFKKEIQDEMKDYVANYIETYMSTTIILDDDGSQSISVNGATTITNNEDGSQNINVGGC